MTNLRMRKGHVAMLDVLGWKGIWEKHEKDVSPIISSARTIRDAAADFERVYAPDKQTYFKGQARFFSDTLVLAVEASDPSRAEEFADMERGLLARQMGKILQQSALLAFPLTFRGAIVEGDFLIDENLILGPAIDKAAQAMNVPNAALVWLCGTRWLIPGQPVTVFDYDMPHQDGRTERVQVLNPFMYCEYEKDLDPVERGVLKRFSESADPKVLLKKQNTEAFLQRAYERWCYETIGAPKPRQR